MSPDVWNSRHVPQVGTGPVDGPDRQDLHPFQVESSPQRENPHHFPVHPNQLTKRRALPVSPEPTALSHSPRPSQSIPYTTPPLEKSGSTFDADASGLIVGQAGLKHSAVSEQVKHPPNTELERGKSTDPENTAREDGNRIEKQGPTMFVPMVGRPSPRVEPSIPVDSPRNGRPEEFRSDVKANEEEKVDKPKAASSSNGSGEKNGREVGDSTEKDVDRVLERTGAASYPGRNGAKDAPGKANGDERETTNTVGTVKGSAVRPEEDSTSKRDVNSAGVGRGHEIGGAERKELQSGAGNKGEREAVGKSGAVSQSSARANTGGQSDILPASRTTGEGSTGNALEKSVAASQKSEREGLGGSDAQPSAGRVPDVDSRGTKNTAQDAKEEGRSSTFKLKDLSSAEPIKGTAGTAALEKRAESNAIRRPQPSGDKIESSFKGKSITAGTTSKEKDERVELSKPAGLETASGLPVGDAPPGTRVRLADLKPSGRIEAPFEDGARDAAKASALIKSGKVEETSPPGPLSGMAKGAAISPVGVGAGDVSGKSTEGKNGAGVRPASDAISNGSGRPEGNGSKVAESSAPFKASAVKNGDEAFHVGTAKLPDSSEMERAISGPNVMLTSFSTGETASKPVRRDETPLPKPKNGDDVAASPTARRAVNSSDKEEWKGGGGSNSSVAMGASKAERSEGTPPGKPGTNVKNTDDMPASPSATRAAELSNSVQQKTGTPRK
jgi:hypothetical protein